MKDNFDISSFPSEFYITTDNMIQQKGGVLPYTGSMDKITNITQYSKGDILVSNIRPYLKKYGLQIKTAAALLIYLFFTLQILLQCFRSTFIILFTRTVFSHT